MWKIIETIAVCIIAPVVESLMALAILGYGLHKAVEQNDGWGWLIVFFGWFVIYLQFSLSQMYISDIKLKRKETYGE